MVIAKKCDRCAVLYEPYTINMCSRRGPVNGMTLISRDFIGDYTDNKVFDLCPRCMESLQKWIEAGGKEDASND